MKRFMILTVALVTAFAFASWDAPAAKAGDFGLHFAGPGYHVDIGRTHHRRAYRSGNRTLGYGRPGYYGGHHHWHDTSHYDYHPGELVRHRNHYHYVPGHYDFHETGHYDYHDGHHGW
jgi:hypothetical protein